MFYKLLCPKIIAFDETSQIADKISFRYYQKFIQCAREKGYFS